MCVCARREGGFVHDVKHMSPRVLRQGGVSREDEGEEEESESGWRRRRREAGWRRDAYRQTKKAINRETDIKKKLQAKTHACTHAHPQRHLCHISEFVKKTGGKFEWTQKRRRLREEGQTRRECKCNSHS